MRRSKLINDDFKCFTLQYDKFDIDIKNPFVLSIGNLYFNISLSLENSLLLYSCEFKEQYMIFFL